MTNDELHKLISDGKYEFEDIKFSSHLCIKVNFHIDLKFKNCIFDKIDIDGSRLNNAMFERCSFTETCFNNLYAFECHFINCIFDRSSSILFRFLDSTFESCVFDNAQLEAGFFENCKLKDCNFDNAFFHSVCFNFCDQFMVSFGQSSGSIILIGINLSEADFSKMIDWDIRYDSTSSGNITLNEDVILDKKEMQTGNITAIFNPNENPSFLGEDLRPYKIERNHGTIDELNELDDLLSKDPDELTMQSFFEKYPHILTANISKGHHGIWVIPQQKFGTTYIADFLAVYCNSLGTHWIGIEIESPKRKVHKVDGDLTQIVNHAAGQIIDWRNWVSENISNARKERSLGGLGLTGISGKMKGLVIVGRRDSSFYNSRNQQKRMTHEGNDIETRTYDGIRDDFEYYLKNTKRI